MMKNFKDFFKKVKNSIGVLNITSPSSIKTSFNRYNIDKICEKYYIQNYSINDDGTVDVDGEVFLTRKNLKNIPLNFGRVTGNFGCAYNELTSLKGCPTYVGGDFYCNVNKLKSLEYCPSYVGKNFGCYNNNLTSLEGFPIVNGNKIDCSYNKNLKNFKGFPEFWEGEVNFIRTGVHHLLRDIPKSLWSKAIYFINEYDVIDINSKVIEDRMREVYNALNIKPS